MGSGPVEGTAIWIPQGNLTPVFNIAMDMNPALLGIVLTLWRICDVVADQVMGNISDNARTRWGRRKPRSTGIKSAPDFTCGSGHKKSPAAHCEPPGINFEYRYLTCAEKSLVISNMLTCFLPPKTALSASSALIWVRFFAS